MKTSLKQRHSWATFALIAMTSLTALTASARVRELPMCTLTEGENHFLTVPGIERARVSNGVIVGVQCPSTGDVILSGLRMGEATVTLHDDKGAKALLPVTVCPSYWSMLKNLFAEDPEITVKVLGDRVVLSGSTANVDVIRRVKQAQTFDKERIVSHVTVSPEALKALLDEFLRRDQIEGVTGELIGSEVCLSGKMYDQAQIDALGERVKAFLSEFPGLTVNTSGLRIFKQKIFIGIEFLSYDSVRARNLGVEVSETLGATASLTYTLHENLTGTVSDAGNLTAQVNTLKRNQVAKKLYSTTLSTQSGEEAEFQSGGTLYKKTSDLYKTNITEIEYGYIIKARPTILDEETVNLEFNLDLRTPLTETDGNADTDVSRYQTRSKYIVRPGESILLSGFNHWNEEEAKRGIPLLSSIPWIGSLFGSTNNGSSSNEMLLVVSVDWAVEDTQGVLNKADKLRTKPVTVEMP